MWGAILSAVVLFADALPVAASPAAVTPAIAEPEWQVITRPDGTEVRYLPPVPTHADYPPRARRLGLEGRTLIEVLLSPAGSILECRTVQTSGDAELDAQSCAVFVARARFEVRGTEKIQLLRVPVVWKLAG